MCVFVHVNDWLLAPQTCGNFGREGRGRRLCWGWPCWSPERCSDAVEGDGADGCVDGPVPLVVLCVVPLSSTLDSPGRHLAHHHEQTVWGDSSSSRMLRFSCAQAQSFQRIFQLSLWLLIMKMGKCLKVCSRCVGTFETLLLGSEGENVGIL